MSRGEPGIRTVARTVWPSPLAIVRLPVRLLATYTRAPSDETASPVGSIPTGSVACTVWPARSTIERLGPPRLVVYPRRPSGERAKRYGPDPTLIVAMSFGRIARVARCAVPAPRLTIASHRSSFTTQAVRPSAETAIRPYPPG